MKLLATLLNAVLALGLLTWAGLHFTVIRIPPNMLPWAKVDLDSPPGWAPRLRINSLSADGEQCLMALARSKLLYKPLDERPVKNGCGLKAGVQIERSHIAYNQVFEARCALVAGLYWFERDLQALAREHLHSDIVRVEQWGTYACRNINARKDPRRSQHATANAIDIAGFVLSDGNTVQVLRDWGADNAKGRFLAAAQQRACRYFNAVLGPNYNAAHRNHFHLDLGRARICR
ncbi:MAG: extensin family protein [Rhodospirillaceae bacterium]